MSTTEHLLVGVWVPVAGNPKETIEFCADGIVRMGFCEGALHLEGRYHLKNLFILPLILLTLGCQTLLSGSETKRDEFESFYTAGFEVSSFVPCGDPGQPGYGKGY